MSNFSEADRSIILSPTLPLLSISLSVVEGGVEAQAEQALANLKNVVEASGGELGKVVKTTVSSYL